MIYTYIMHDGSYFTGTQQEMQKRSMKILEAIIKEQQWSKPCDINISVSLKVSFV